MKNLESFENFSSEQIENLESTIGGQLVPTQWTGADGKEGDDFYDSQKDRVVYL